MPPVNGCSKGESWSCCLREGRTVFLLQGRPDVVAVSWVRLATWKSWGSVPGIDHIIRDLFLIQHSADPVSLQSSHLPLPSLSYWSKQQ